MTRRKGTKTDRQELIRQVQEKVSKLEGSSAEELGRLGIDVERLKERLEKVERSSAARSRRRRG